jgi:hypothetical protein
MEVSYVVVVFFIVAMIMVLWDMESVPPPPYNLLKHSHGL